MGLTKKQAAFVAAFRGNATEAARIAGYAGGDNAHAVAGHRLLKNPTVQRALRARQAKIEQAASGGDAKPEDESADVDSTILDLAAEQRKLTEIANDASATHRDRIRAIEVLARMQGHFIRQADAVGDEEGGVQIVVWRGNGRGPAPESSRVDVDSLRQEALRRLARDKDADPQERLDAFEELDRLMSSAEVSE